MQDAQRIDRILADISLCNRLDDSDIRSIVNRLTGHCSDNVATSLGNCLAWLDDDIGDSVNEPEIDGIEVTVIRADASQFDRQSGAIPAWMTGAAA